MKAKVVIITGANSGIGYETAKAVAAQQATLVMACRNLVAADGVRQQLIAETGNDDIHLMKLDLASPDAVKAFVDEFLGRYDHLDVLVNNAGVVHMSYEVSPEGQEMTLAINHLGPFLLTHLLLDSLKASQQGRIINVSSNAHYQGVLDLQAPESKKHYKPFKAYANSKLANVLFTLALAQRLQHTAITVNAVHPGVVRTNIWPNDKWYQAMVSSVFKAFSLHASKGAETSIYLATSEEVSAVSGRYFVKCRPVTPSELARDEALQEQLWSFSETCLGI